MTQNTKHQHYTRFQSMKDRCRNKNNKQYKNYGGRGISVCERWLDPIHGLNNFISDMGEMPEGFTLDRINNNGNYEPSNCRWSSRTTQQRNQTVTRLVTVEGVTYIAAELAEKFNLKTDTIVERAKTAQTFSDLTNPTRKVFTAGLALGGKASGAKKQALTHCKNGHPFDAENTKITKEGWRRCKKCHNARASKWRQENL